jgi:hypothetical protein
MVGLILLGSFIIFVSLLLNIQRDFYYEQVMREADRFSSSVISATNHSMLEDDRDATRSIIDKMGQQEGISTIRIYDHVFQSTVRSRLQSRQALRSLLCVPLG